MAAVDNGNKITILALVAGMGVLIWLLIKKMKPNPISVSATASTPPALTVADRISKGYNAALKTFDDAEVKKYAGWIDALVDGAKQLKASGVKKATEQMIKNASVLKSMSDANLKAVVDYWQNVRLRPLTSSEPFQGFYTDETETMPAFLRRLQDIGY